jgi:hypothetical protein
VGKEQADANILNCFLVGMVAVLNTFYFSSHLDGRRSAQSQELC